MYFVSFHELLSQRYLIIRFCICIIFISEMVDYFSERETTINDTVIKEVLIDHHDEHIIYHFISYIQISFRRKNLFMCYQHNFVVLIMHEHKELLSNMYLEFLYSIFSTGKFSYVYRIISGILHRHEVFY